MRAIVNSDYRAHSDILDIFQINSFQIAKFMFCYHNQLLPPMFLNLFLTSSQVHSYFTRAANHYRSHSSRTNVKPLSNLRSFTKVLNSGTLSQYQLLLHLIFSPLKQKCCSSVLSNKSWIEQTALTHFLFINDSRGGLYYKPSGFLRPPRHHCEFYYSFCFYFNKTNKWWWCAAGWGRILTTGLTIMGSHFQ